MLQHGILLLLVGPLVPSIIETFEIGEGTAGFLLAMGSLGFLVGPLVAGATIDRAGVKAALFVGLAIEAVFLVVFGAAGLFFAAAAANFLYHFGASFLETGANVMPTLTKSAGTAHSRMNYIHMFFSVGAFVGPFLIGLYLSASGLWRPIFYFALVPTAALAVWTAAQRIPKPDRHTIRDRSGILETLRDRATIFGAITLLLYVGAEVGVSSWIVYYLQKVQFDQGLSEKLFTERALMRTKW